MEKLNQYIEENKERFLNELFELIRIPSISSEVEHKPDMYRCAEKWKSLLLAAGADKAEVYETEGNPITYGEKIIDPSRRLYWYTDIWTLCLSIRWNCGIRSLLNP